ncbi:MAG TPA: sugar phosphate nucleotidyltransferase [Kofleriaceae bacterium]|nr:sugar phosphate nucleotidyltransferase [Kofleriaceae bacterium]
MVVLAGGEGSRLQPLTRALYGRAVPKQFAVIAGERSLMQSTIERALELTTPDRISVVVTAHHESIAREQVADYPGVELVIQPHNLDTGPGLLLPLIRILSISPEAHVVFFPSDHYVPHATPLVEALRGAARDAITLVGVEPDGPEVEYGWIVPGERTTGASHRVERFHEKPAPQLAEHLYQRGGLWNTFILAGPVMRFWELARRHLPDHAAALETYAASIGGLAEALALLAAYRVMPKANFSRDLLAEAESLSVIAVRGTGWSDWGAPARVFASLAGTPDHDRLVERIREPATRPYGGADDARSFA